ncbi:MAG: ChbG/HpnK family deacetylase [Clostridia bacterium]|nr:ChbG/HpnK family deacetylase [Clostridia bacterium]
MSKLLIINADDYGYNRQQNAAIEELIQGGLITSTSVMPVAKNADECEKIKDTGVSVGVHFTLNSDSDTDRWKSLTLSPSFGGENGMPENPFYLTTRATHAAVRRELEAQYDFIGRRGVRVDHADSHCGTLYGINLRRFYIDAFDFCAERGLPFRFPKTGGFIERQIGRALPNAVYALQNAVVRQAEKRGVKLLDDLVSNPWSMERIKCYENLRAYYLDCVDNCIDGVTELFLHPAAPADGDSGSWMKRVYEYELLKSGDLLQRARDRGIKVVTWQEAFAK